MQDLHLVGYTTDRRHLIFSARRGAKSGSFLVPVDEELVSVVAELGAHPAPADDAEVVEETIAPPPPRVEARLTVREVQARLRAGESVGEVAADAGVEEEWVERFAPPVRAEQRQVVERALRLPMQRSRAGESAKPLGVAVASAMAERGVVFTDEGFAASWTSRLIGQDHWVIEFHFTQRGRKRTVGWTFDAAAGRITTNDRTASQIGFVSPPTAKPAGKSSAKQASSPTADVDDERPAQGPRSTRGDGRPDSVRSTKAVAAAAASTKKALASRPAAAKKQAAAAKKAAAAAKKAAPEKTASKKKKKAGAKKAAPKKAASKKKAVPKKKKAAPKKTAPKKPAPAAATPEEPPVEAPAPEEPVTTPTAVVDESPTGSPTEPASAEPEPDLRSADEPTPDEAVDEESAPDESPDPVVASVDDVLDDASADDGTAADDGDDAPTEEAYDAPAQPDNRMRVRRARPGESAASDDAPRRSARPTAAFRSGAAVRASSVPGSSPAPAPARDVAPSGAPAVGSDSERPTDAEPERPNGRRPRRTRQLRAR